jgi:hypothetical protein
VPGPIEPLVESRAWSRVRHQRGKPVRPGTRTPMGAVDGGWGVLEQGPPDAGSGGGRMEWRQPPPGPRVQRKVLGRQENGRRGWRRPAGLQRAEQERERLLFLGSSQSGAIQFAVTKFVGTCSQVPLFAAIILGAQKPLTNSSEGLFLLKFV